MVDKRFWSGAILVATVVVAGAGALPALLLAPGAPSAPVPPIVAAPAERKAEPVVARAEPQPVAKVQAPALAQPAPSPAPMAPTPQVVAEPPVPEAPVPVREAAPVAFPPVQPVDVATGKTEPVQPIAAPTRMRPASATADRPVTEKPVRTQRAAADRVTKRKRQVVRPALYPIREFFAWRR